MTIAGTGAGHGGKKTNGRWMDPGAVGSGYQEADVARMINQKMLAIAKVTDTTDHSATSTDGNLANITRNINNAPDGYHISNHLNAYKPNKATGVEVLFGSVAQKALAAKMSKAIADALGIVDRGAKDGTWLYLARNSKPNKKVLLIEWCFIDNQSDMKKLMANMDNAVNAVMKVLGYSTAAPSPSKPSNAFNIDNYWTTKPAQIRLLKDEYAYKEKELAKRVGDKVKKGTILTVTGIEYSGKYPRFKLKSGLYITTRKDTVEPYTKSSGGSTSTNTSTSNRWITKKGTATVTTSAGIRLRGATASGSVTDPIKQALLATLAKGSKVAYDRILVQPNGHVWVRQPRSGNKFGWLPVAQTKNGKVTGGYWASGVSI